MHRSKRYKWSLCASIAVLLILMVAATCAGATQADKELLGKLLFKSNISAQPNGQSCESCHVASVGFTDPDKEFATSAGVMPGRFGSRNAPSNRYRAENVPFGKDPLAGLAPIFGFRGGQFWDGRSANLFEQAKGPFLNPLELHSPNRRQVVNNFRQSDLAPLFKEVYGPNVFKDFNTAYDNIADAIAAFELSDEMNPFNSKFDKFTAAVLAANPGVTDPNAQAGLLLSLTNQQAENFGLTQQEYNGFKMFNDPTKTQPCSACHSWPRVTATLVTLSADKATFSDERYFNIGLPRNPDNPFYTLNPSLNPLGADFVDFGLGGFLKNNPALAQDINPDTQMGTFKVPTLRNIALTSPYMHNGVFKTLKEVVHFYNKRDVDGVIPEVGGFNNIITTLIPVPGAIPIGNMGLTDQEEDDIIAFLKTLTDEDLLPE